MCISERQVFLLLVLSVSIINEGLLEHIFSLSPQATVKSTFPQLCGTAGGQLTTLGFPPTNFTALAFYRNPTTLKATQAQIIGNIVATGETAAKGVRSCIQSCLRRLLDSPKDALIQDVQCHLHRSSAILSHRQAGGASSATKATC